MSACILVVEDDAIIARDIRATLSGLGYVVPAAVASGASALEAVASHRPDLVLMDVHIQGDIDGIETAARIHDSHGTPVIYLTSYSDEKTLTRAKQTGPYGYLIKPFTDRDLRTAIEVALQRRALEVELRAASRAASQQRALTDALIENLGEGVLAMDRERNFIIVNHAARRVFAAGAEVGKPLPPDWAALHLSMRPDGTALAAVDGALVRALRGENTDGLTFSLQRPGASEAVWLEASGRPVRNESGEVIAGISVYRDVTERKRVAEDLQRARDLIARERTLLNATLDHIEDGVVLYDSRRRVLFANASFTAMFGIRQESLEGMTEDLVFAHLATLVDDAASFLEHAWGRDESTEEYVFSRPRRRILRRSATPLNLPEGECLLVTWHDVTAERDLLSQRERQLHIDALTGIANRRAAEATLRVEDGRQKRMGTPLSVAVFDVDHFKRVNDEFGHATGDEVLRRVAATLAAEARGTDLVARWGGEEFLAVLLAPLAGAITFSERARVAVERLHCPRVEHVTISVGIAQLGPDETPLDAVARADQRLYEAKKAGRNRVAS